MNSLPLFFSRIFSTKSFYHQPHTDSFKDLLNGHKAFYNQPNYVKAIRQDFAQHKPLPVNYTWNTEKKIIRIVKQIFSVIIFPIGIYTLLHNLAGKIIVPASTYSKKYVNSTKSNIQLNGEWKYKRITVEVDGYKIYSS